MMRAKRAAALAGGVGFGLAMALGEPAAAQDQSRQSAGYAEIGEVVVTAQKREQSLQDVPVSITALTAEAIEQNQISNVSDLDSIAPNLQVKVLSGSSGAPQFMMRGAVGIGTAPGADKGISVYLDGVYLGSSAGQIFDVADIERIEVLRGPQGTLFGRNSSAGAVSIITKGPAGEFKVKQRVTLGNYDTFQSQTRVDTPQAGPLSAALTYTHMERRGDVRNLGGGTVWDFSQAAGTKYARVVSPDYLGGRNSESVALAVRGEFSPELDVAYKFDYSTAHFTPDGVGLVALNFNGAFGAAIGGAIANIYATTPNATPISDERPKAVNNWFTTNSYTRQIGHNLTANWQISDSLSLRNVMGYRKSYFRAPGSNFDAQGGLAASAAFLNVLYATVPQPQRAALVAARTGAPLLMITASAEGFDDQFSNETQLNYNSDLVTLTTGAIYFWQKTNRGGLGSGAGSLSLTPVPNFVIPSTGALPSIIHIESYAAYGQAEFHATEKIDLIAGMRVTRDEKKGVDRAVAANPVPFTYKDTRATYMFGVNYKPSDSVLLYAKYGTGYISGGQLGFAYDPETAKSWEAGMKADWLDHRLRTNLAGFFVEYGNLQNPNSGRTFAAVRPDLVNAGQILANVGDAEAYGFELETTYKPTDPITLTANLGYTHFKYTELRPELLQVGSIGVHNRPRWTNTFAAQYDTDPLFGDARLQLRVNATYRSDQVLTSTVAPFRPVEYVEAAHTGKVWLFDARATLSDIEVGGANVRISAWGRNIFNNKKPNYGADLVAGMTIKYESAPTYGIDLVAEF